jgi:membrane-associated phospholipid phosphatase
MFALAYGCYELVRGLVGVSDSYKPFGNATRIIDFERTLHVFVEPQIQAWVVSHAHWLLDIADWTYINAHFALTVGALAFIYLRRNDSFYFVRNMFMIAMLIALVGYGLYPTAPPRLMPQWGFTDAIQQFTGVTVEKGASGALLNAYAAVPSMHVCFALMIGIPMSRLVRNRIARVIWRIYPAFITFVVVATGNHYFTDVALGALTAGISAVLAKQLLARARPDTWAFTGVPA